MIIALTGISGSGKSHIAQLLSSIGFEHLRFSTLLKKSFPDNGNWKGEYETYKHYLCSQAEKINVTQPDLFIDDLLLSIGCRKVDLVVIDDLRTPRQYAALSKFCQSCRMELVVIQVTSPTSKKVSFMDEFALPITHTIFNDQLSDSEIIREVSHAIHKSQGV